ncbi:hypothetical protein DFR75_1011140 [Nocardia ignorata]|uniref:Uncharacterized protein n=1 Tax=Nocardia ignorata TaxID=145285 RepID=A0A4R6PUT0_NOCIG|nr:hypothetical protein DFR75_1011140 [Nocardia ignorata]
MVSSTPDKLARGARPANPQQPPRANADGPDRVSVRAIGLRQVDQCASTISPSAGAGTLFGMSTPITIAPSTKVAAAHQKLVV